MEQLDRESWHPTSGQLQQLFRETMQAMDGTVVDVIDDGRSLWGRAVLPPTLTVRPGDRLRGGVAMRTAGSEVHVHPFTLREVCTNGAVRSHAVATRIVPRILIDPAVASSHGYAVVAVLDDVAAALHACASPAVFEAGVGEMRDALSVEADVVLERLEFLLILESLGSSRVAESVRRVLMRSLRQLSLSGGRERSAFAFGNALTAAGRDAASPAVRWVLEEYGASVFAAAVPGAVPPAASIGRRPIHAVPSARTERP